MDRELAAGAGVEQDVDYPPVQRGLPGEVVCRAEDPMYSWIVYVIQGGA